LAFRGLLELLPLLAFLVDDLAALPEPLGRARLERRGLVLLIASVDRARLVLALAELRLELEGVVLERRRLLRRFGELFALEGEQRSGQEGDHGGRLLQFSMI